MIVRLKRLLLLLAAGAPVVLAHAAPEHVELESVWTPSIARQTEKTTAADVKTWVVESAKRAGSATAPEVRVEQGFWIAESKGFLFLANTETGLLITGWNDGQPEVRSIYHFPTRTEWLSGAGGPLWEIAWKTPADFKGTNEKTQAPACAVRIADGIANLQIQWPVGSLGGAETKAGVNAGISLSASDSIPQFRITVDNQNPRAGIWAVRFPILHGVGKKGGLDAVVGTLGTSRLVRNFSAEITDHLYAEQLRVLTMGDSSLYAGTQDPKNWQKYFAYKAGGDLSILTLPDDTAAPGQSYTQPFPIVIGPMTGDWFDAAQRYRQWALKQDWAKRGTVDTWKGPGREMTKVMLWLQTLSPQANNVPTQVDSLVALNKRLGVKSGVHYYQWWAKDAFSPTVLTAGFKKGLPEGWLPLREAGMDILPYFNVLYWKAGWRGDKRETEWPNVKEVDPGFAEAKAAACQPYPGVEGDDSADEKFRVYEDYYMVYGGNNVMVPMCRETKLWQDHLVALAKLVEKSGSDMVYLDQGGVPPRSPCFNPSHGHKLGGGGQWADGTRKMIERIKFDTGRELAICCEGAYEGYLDLVENQFMHYWPWLAKKDTLCPLFETVYHDYTLFMGAVKPHPDATAYAIDIGTRLLHGNQFRAEARMFDDPKFSDQSAFLTRMAKLRQVGLPYLSAGQLVRPPGWHTAPGRVKADWIFKNGELQQTIGYPAMERGQFRLPDGSEAVFVVNFSSQDAQAKLDLQAWSAGSPLSVTLSDGTKSQVSPDAPIPVAARDGIMITKTK